MKKLLIPLVIIVLLILVGAGAYLYMHKKAASEMASVPTPKNSAGFLGSIQDALSKSLSLSCTFTDSTGRSTTAYIKAGAIRADVVGKDPTQPYNSTSVIIKDKKMYVWDTTKKTGMVMDMSEMMPTGSPVTLTPQTTTQPSQSQNHNSPDVLGMLEQYKNNCKPAVVADSLFVVPTDITFTDLSKMMPSGVPTGTVPTGMSQEQIKQMMQQYAPTGTSTGY